MPVSSATGNIANLPLLPRDARLRGAAIAAPEQSQGDQADTRRPVRDSAIAQTSSAIDAASQQSLLRELDTTTLDLRSAPELDELPTSQRSAILSYLENASLGVTNRAEGVELLVGVDTFV